MPSSGGGIRRAGREACLQSLYLLDNCTLLKEDAWKAVFTADHKPASEALDFGKKLFDGVMEKKEELDEIIQRHTHNWKLDRIASVDRNILRLAAYEILAMHETPLKVVINEAVEIAKKYSTDKSGKFVNGILDKLKNERKEENK